MILVVGLVVLQRVPVDILPVFKAPGRPGAHLLLRHAGDVDRKDDHHADRALGGAAPGAERLESKSVPGVSVIKAYFRDRRRSERSIDALEFAGPRYASHVAAQHAAAGRAAVRSDRHAAARLADGEKRLPRRSPRERRGPGRCPQHARRGQRVGRAGGRRRQGSNDHGLSEAEGVGSPRTGALDVIEALQTAT